MVGGGEWIELNSKTNTEFVSHLLNRDCDAGRKESKWCQTSSMRALNASRFEFDDHANMTGELCGKGNPRILEVGW